MDIPSRIEPLMKCHECGLFQTDANTACSGCGASFSANSTSSPQIIIYPDSPAKGLNGKLIGCAVALMLVAGVPVLFRARAADSAQLQAARSEQDRGGTWKHVAESHKMIDEACMQSLLEMGSDELGARAACYDDPRAKEQIRKGYEQEAKIRNAVAADRVSRIELLISTTTSDVNTPDQPFTLRLRLYDQNGNPASSEGLVTFSFSPEQAVWGGMRSARIYKSNATIVHITSDDSYLPLYQFDGFVAKKEQLDGATDIEITATFADSLEASAHFSIDYISE